MSEAISGSFRFFSPAYRCAHAGYTYFPLALRNAALMRSCQPGPSP